jgi:DNA-binding response OmpR family regulator
MAEAEKVVVLVTGDPDLREDATYSFPPPFEVVVAGDAREALRIMKSRRPSLAIVDTKTGSAGGFNLAREMHAAPTLEDVPVLMLLERHQDSWLAGQAGARRWRTKPVDGIELVQEALELLPS